MEASGFIGLHLVETLIQRDYRVVEPAQIGSPPPSSIKTICVYGVMRRYRRQYLPCWISLILFAVIWSLIALLSVVLRRAEK